MQIRIYVYLVAYHYGIGLSAFDAVESCKRASGLRATTDPKKCRMFRLPPGVTEVWVDEMGTVHWQGSTAQAEKMHWDRKVKAWVTPEGETHG